MALQLYMLKYNNYYNRIIKKENSLWDYLQYRVLYNGQDADPNGNTATVDEVNFAPDNYVDTTQVVNWAGDIPDYILVYDTRDFTISHWFVTDSTKTRGGQLKLRLHRDLVVDYYDFLINPQTKIFVEKATVPAFNDLIFNSENMTFNQIKTSEVLLKDASECPWICIYAASHNADGTTTTFDISTGASVPISRIFNSQAEFNSWAVKQAFDAGKALIGGSPRLQIAAIRGYLLDNYSVSGNYTFREYVVYENGSSITRVRSMPLASAQLLKQDWTNGDVAAQFLPRWEEIENALGNYVDQFSFADRVIYDTDAYNAFSSDINQFVQVNTTAGTRYYKITGSSKGYQTTFTPGTGPNIGTLYSVIKPILDAIYASQSALVGNKVIDYTVAFGNALVPNIEDVTDSISNATTTIGTTRYHLKDAPYDLFCMPYSDSLRITNSLVSSFKSVTANKQLALDVAKRLITKYSGAGTVYDAQIVPYCPLTSTIISKSGGIVTMDLADGSGQIYTAISNEAGDTTVGYIMHASVSSFSRQIALESPIVITDYKIQSECDLYRLCSPNYNGVFEFNAAKNGGVEIINVQCTYKPFTPYIKLYPSWGRLYGNNFNQEGFDARGLICGGDFSLPATTSAWETYELQNKNYQLSFDRQIQNLEINNAVQREREAWNIASGVVGAGVQGGATGLIAGGPWAALAGATIGAGASLVGGIADRQLNERLRTETIDYTKDQFGYQLGNIKALPQSLSKVTAYNIDNKYFPFLEFYTCSEVEKQALRDKIKYNGMTVMAIGTLEYYLNSYTGEDPMYFKGQLIRGDGFTGDYHILNALAAEIYQGVFL